MSPEATDFLYPFIEGDERDASSLLADLSRSAEAKATDSAALRAATLGRLRPELEAAAAAMASRFAAGGRLFTFGNGGSSTDADLAARLFTCPPDGGPLPALSLTADPATVTALANDVGYELVFSRQLMAAATEVDMALAISTSGNSTNLLRAAADARRRGILTVGLVGYDGGQLAASGDLDHCLVVAADSVHRIQEVQAALVYELWSGVRDRVTTP